MKATGNTAYQKLRLSLQISAKHIKIIGKVQDKGLS